MQAGPDALTRADAGRPARHVAAPWPDSIGRAEAGRPAPCSGKESALLDARTLTWTQTGGGKYDEYDEYDEEAGRSCPAARCSSGGTGVSFPETRRQVILFMNIASWPRPDRTTPERCGRDPAWYMARPTYSGDVAPQKRRTITRPRATGVQLGGDVARDMIMFGATRVFAARGYRAASVEDLLEAGQVSRRTFYRFFKSKDDVALAMYTLGTSSLIEACRRAITQETELVAQLERCLDIHLRNARDRGRLVFVLGGEAQSLESPLYARRMDVHDALVDLLHTSHPSSARLDPLLLRTLLLGVEAITRRVLEEGDEGRRITEASIARARRVMMRIMTATIAGTGAHVAPLPTIG